MKRDSERQEMKLIPTGCWVTKRCFRIREAVLLTGWKVGKASRGQ